MKVKTEVQASFSLFSNTCLPALLPMPCTHPVELGLRFLITSINLKLRLLSLAGLQEVRFPQFKGNLRTACAWLLSPKRSTLKLGLPGIVSSIRARDILVGEGVKEDRCFHSCFGYLLWELQLSWVPSQPRWFISAHVVCQLRWWAGLAPPDYPENVASPSSQHLLCTSGWRWWGWSWGRGGKRCLRLTCSQGQGALVGRLRQG